VSVRVVVGAEDVGTAAESEAGAVPQREERAIARRQPAAERRFELAMRYLRIKDLVRVPSSVPWLRAAEARLAELHLQVAARLERAGETTAAEREREKARALTPTPQRCGASEGETGSGTSRTSCCPQLGHEPSSY